MVHNSVRISLAYRDRPQKNNSTSRAEW